MKHEYTHCPVCHNRIVNDRRIGSSIICQCGWTLSPKQAVAEKIMVQRAARVIVLTAILCTLSFVHVVKWDTHSFEVLPLLVKKVAGIGNYHDYDRLGDICSDRHDYDCLHDTYVEKLRLKPNEIDTLSKLGKLDLQLGNLQESLAYFAEYFSKEGDSVEAHYQYGKALGRVGQVKDSIQHFEETLEARPGVLQVTVVKAYVDMLMTNKKYKSAARVIVRFRRYSQHASYFLEGRMKDIKKRAQAKNKS